MPRLIPKLRRTKSQDGSEEQPKLRRSKSDQTGSRMPRRFRLRSKSPKTKKAPKGLGDNFMNDLDESNTSATMDCSSSCASADGRGHVRSRLLQRNQTIDGTTSSSSMTPEQRQRYNRLRELPSTANYASSHILVNRERMRLGKAPLHRSRDLDAVARQRAQEMVCAGKLHPRLCIESLAENVQKGPSIRMIHQMIMADCLDERSRNNILSDHYTRFGVGCAHDCSSGLIYMSQIFQAPAVFSEELKSHLFNNKAEHEGVNDNGMEDIEESKELL